MDLKSIGGNSSGAALDKFQAIRDLAKKKLDGSDNRIRLADLLKQKQTELISGKKSTPLQVVEKLQAEKIPLASLSEQAQGAQGLTGYGRAGATQKTDTKPKLGRYIDFMA